MYLIITYKEVLGEATTLIIIIRIRRFGLARICEITFWQRVNDGKIEDNNILDIENQNWNHRYIRNKLHKSV